MYYRTIRAMQFQDLAMIKYLLMVLAMHRVICKIISALSDSEFNTCHHAHILSPLHSLTTMMLKMGESLDQQLLMFHNE